MGLACVVVTHEAEAELSMVLPSGVCAGSCGGSTHQDLKAITYKLDACVIADVLPAIRFDVVTDDRTP